MRHLCFACREEAELREFLRRDATLNALSGARSVLAQVFIGHGAGERLHTILEILRDQLPHAVITGCTSAGEICEGRVVRRTVVVSLAIFTASDLHPRLFTCERGEERATGLAIAEFLAPLADLRGLLLLAPPVQIDCAGLIEGLATSTRTVTVFGGGAAAIDRDQRSLVFLGEQVRENAVVAVAMCGSTLNLQSLTSLAWKALGPPLLLTDVDGLTIRKIDGKPALEVYRRYLGVNRDDDLFLLEFPMLAERDGTLLARNPVAVNADHSLTLFADVRPGETVRLGYIDVDRIIDDALSNRNRLGGFGAEAVFIYSCVCRRFTLQDDTQMETLPFQEIAPTAGFFTYGEFSQVDGRLMLHNSTEVVVGLREGDGERRLPTRNGKTEEEDDTYRLRHIQMTSRLFNFIAALTEELEVANRALQVQAERDALTGAFNRRMFDARLDAEISRFKRHGGSVSIALLDLDHFKSLNDSFGHVIGDYILATLSHAVEATMRPCDQFFRYGGEEFAIILPETRLQGALVVAERIRRTIEAQELHRAEGPLPSITASFGVATYPDHGRVAESLVAAADAALYRSKADGRNRTSAAGDSPCPDTRRP